MIGEQADFGRISLSYTGGIREFGFTVYNMCSGKRSEESDVVVVDLILVGTT